MVGQILSEEQVESYYREGFVVVRQLVSEAVVQSVRHEADRTHFTDGGEWTPQIFDFAEPGKDAALHQCLVDPRVVGAVNQLLDNEAAAYFGMLAVVPAHGGKGLEWHQDNQYTHLLGKALNVFIALCDITPDKAILWVAPRSHLLGVQPAEIHNGHRRAAAPDNGQPLPTLRAGDACIFDRTTLHRSLTNETDKPRYAYAAQYAQWSVREATTGRRPERLLRVADLRKAWSACCPA
ncbi:MAG TPA: phytanoyl-CoA dioxygenase family protein [Lacipirellulaceae bacterium]|mgnify:FL=1|nr:phytanoyl-CoA dioxygenase family protein [Lacipirellulaceae bacterium]